MHPFAGKPAIVMLSFMTQLRGAFDMLDAHEVADVRVVSRFIYGNARYILSEHMEMSADDYWCSHTITGSWPDVCNYLIGSFVTD